MKIAELFLESDIIRLQDKTGVGLYYDLTNDCDESPRLSDATVKAALPFNDWRELIENTEEVDIVYNPTLSKKFIKNENKWLSGIYNTYNAPRNTRTLPKPELSKCMELFFTHLLPDTKSREYVYDWLNIMLTSRNFTMLVMVGGQGIGKGTFGKIVKLLVGQQNFHETTGNNIFTGRFNGELESKHAVFLDEFHLRASNKEALAKLKGLINDTISIEGKGKEAKTITNRASFFLATNVFEGIPIEYGDRRFSVVDLTELPTKSNEYLQECINNGHLFTEDSIAALHSFLLNRKPDQMEMLKPFNGSIKAKVAEAARPEWVNVLVEDFKDNNSVMLSLVQETIKANCSGGKVGRPTIAKWFRVYDKAINVNGIGPQRTWLVDCTKILKGE